MGWAGFQELYQRKDRFNIRLLARDSKKNRKMLDKYANDPAVTVIWGDMTRYEDVLEGVKGSDYVLHVGGMVSPAADYYPEKTLKVNVTSAEYVVKAVLAQPNATTPVKANTFSLTTMSRVPSLYTCKCTFESSNE